MQQVQWSRGEGEMVQSKRQRRYTGVVRWLGGCAVVAGLGGVPVHAGLPGGVTDGPEGMTCQYFATAARMAWQREGGDWVDADGRPFGERPFARADITPARGDERVSWDVTALVDDGMSARRPAGAFLLRVLSARERASLAFHSRESADSAQRPMLVLEWADGRRERLPALADSALNCSTRKSVGAADALKLSAQDHVVIAFAPPRSGGRLVRAELVLSVSRSAARPLTVGVFSPALPMAGDAPARAGIAAATSGDRGLERDPEVLLVERFEDEDWNDGWTDYSAGSKVDLVAGGGDDGFVPLDGKALKVTVARGKLLGLSAHRRLAARGEAEPEEMHFRYALRLGESWDPVRSGGKLPGFAGTYRRAGWGGRRADGSNGWSARGAFFQLRTAAGAHAQRRGIGSYVYHVGMEDYGSNWGWNQGPTGMLEKNRWYSVEQQVRMNTPGRADGILRAWIDGQLVFEKTDLHLRDLPDLRIESLWLNIYHGGTTPAAQDMSLYIDNLVIARRYIGPYQAPR